MHSLLLYVYVPNLCCSRGESRIPWRAIAYTLISIFQFFAEPMILTGLACILCAGVNLLSTAKGETYDRAAKANHGSKDNGYFSDLYSYLVAIKEQNKIGVLVFLGAYFAANIVIFFVVLWGKHKKRCIRYRKSCRNRYCNCWLCAYFDCYMMLNIYLVISSVALEFIKQTAVAEQATNGNGPSYWIPYAKAFGNILDFNGSIIVLPICRTFLRMSVGRGDGDVGGW